jgi:cysteinyl-tRNA synthetase
MKPIRIYNSYTDQLEIFTPIKPGEVSLYVCGPTVYGDVHIGNLRPVVVFDVLKRMFIASGYRVRHVSNITDIDDKIIDKAHAEKVSEDVIAKRYEQAYLQQLQAINASLPDVMPKVTQHIDSIIRFIQVLLEKGFAYQREGNVYFRVDRVPQYGTLSHIHQAQLRPGARVQQDSGKDNPLDFALWKKTDSGIRFSAQFGEGRPGWHTECVVMIFDTLNQPMIDIHGGGFDLKFPHHENEIAQSLAVNQTRLANYWMHNGFINLDQEKMSKSKGNVWLAKDFIHDYGGPLLRYILLATHYRVPVNINQLILDNAKIALQKIELTYQQLAIHLQLHHQSLIATQTPHLQPFLEALYEDLNTANALTVLLGEVKTMNIALREEPDQLDNLKRGFFTIQSMLTILGLDLKFVILSSDDQKLYQDYAQAKSNKDFKKSDELRKILTDRKILI